MKRGRPVKLKLKAPSPRTDYAGRVVWTKALEELARRSREMGLTWQQVSIRTGVSIPTVRAKLDPSWSVLRKESTKELAKRKKMKVNGSFNASVLGIPQILGFNGRYRFLSNFADCPIGYEGQVYWSVEHAYQAAKCADPEDRLKFFGISAGQAKRLGRKVRVREDWESVKVELMRQLVLDKFTQEPYKTLLLETGDAYIEETNDWGDEFWGVCKGRGTNVLGNIIMGVRDALREAKEGEEPRSEVAEEPSPPPASGHA